MSFGSPVVCDDSSKGTQFRSLRVVNTNREDPNSFDETLLQKLIAETPNVLPVREFLPSTSALFSLGREIPVDIGGSGGYIDNLLVTNDGYIVIVETKLYRNPEATRSVVTQVLQYGMAVSQLSILELEDKIRKGQNPSLGPAESIRDCVVRLASSNSDHSSMLADDFEEAVERHLRQGEYLLLVVSDGIRLGVERVTQWLNDQGKSSPFKFGLVELKFYGLGDQRLVIPRTVMMTRELSRHVVVVEIKPTAEVSVTAHVTDKFRNAYGGQVQETRSVKTSAPPLDKLQYLSLVSAEDLPSANSIVDQLEVARFAQSGTATCLRFGFVFPADEGTFIPLVYLGKADAFLLIPRKLLLALDDALGVKLRTAGSELGFYRQEQVPSPLAPSLNVKLGKLAQHLPEFMSFMESYRDSLTAVLQQNQELA